MSITIHNVTKSFGASAGAVAALRDVSLTIPDGQLVALLGPSGSGKTTLLRIIAGLEFPDAGHVLFDGADVHDRPVGRRGVGFVFQHYALFRHMTVFENIAFGLRVRPRRARPSRADIRAKVHELLTLIQLEGLEHRYPSQLSGGQRQRVALARALAIEPKVLLLDEPFGALDARVRQSLRRWLRKLHEQIHVTSVFVTHDQEEALELADRVVVMNAGRIEQTGPPDEVFHAPANAFVMEFLGNVNLFHGRIDRSGRGIFGSLVVERAETSDEATGHHEVVGGRRSDEGQGNGNARDSAQIGNRESGVPAQREVNGDPPRLARLMVRPHELELLDHPNGRPSIEATVLRIQAAGPLVRVELDSAGQLLVADIPHPRSRELHLTPGQRLFVFPRASRVFYEEGEDYSI